MQGNVSEGRSNNQAGGLEEHPLAAIWPPMDEDEYRGLVEDVRVHGVRDPITRYDGQILDGRNRYRAAREAGRDAPIVDLPEGVDPVAFVIAKNGHRRSLKQEVKAQCVVKCRKWAPTGRPRKGGHVGTLFAKGDTLAPFPKQKTNAEMAAEAGVSKRAIQRAKEMHREGHGDAIIRGETSYTKVKRRESKARPVTRMERLIAANDKLKQANVVLEEENRAMRDRIDATDASPSALAAENEVLRQQLDQCRQDRSSFLEQLRGVRKDRDKWREQVEGLVDQLGL